MPNNTNNPKTCYNAKKDVRMCVLVFCYWPKLYPMKYIIMISNEYKNSMQSFVVHAFITRSTYILIIQKCQIQDKHNYRFTHFKFYNIECNMILTSALDLVELMLDILFFNFVPSLSSSQTPPPQYASLHCLWRLVRYKYQWGFNF